jgi:diacylglycerol kinase (ATP)
MRRHFIINPSSGKGRGRSLIEELEHFFSSREDSLFYHLAASRNEAIELTRQALREGAEQVIAVGGDGTLNAVANGFFDAGQLISPPSNLAFVPVGTGCDYLRTWGKNKSWREAISSGIVEWVDIGALCLAGGAPLYFVNMASVGLAAEVVRRRSPGGGSYLLPVVSGLFTYPTIRVTVGVDDQLFEGDALAVLVAKGNFAGGGMRVGETVTLTDGQFEVTTIAPLGIRDLWRAIPLYRGGLEDGNKIRKFFGSKISIRSLKKQPVEADGDFVGAGDLTITIHPKALPLCVGTL